MLFKAVAPENTKTKEKLCEGPGDLNKLLAFFLDSKGILEIPTHPPKSSPLPVTRIWGRRVSTGAVNHEVPLPFKPERNLRNYVFLFARIFTERKEIKVANGFYFV